MKNNFEPKPKQLLVFSFSLLTKILLLLTLSFSLLTTKAQNLDSLYAVWHDKSQPDSSRVNAYYLYVWYGYLATKPDTVEVLVQDLHRFAKEKNYPKAAALGHNLQGLVYINRGDNERAMEHLNQVIGIGEENGFKKVVADCYIIIGTVHTRLGNYAEALNVIDKARMNYEALGDENGLAFCYGNMGGIFHQQDSYAKALEYYQKALAIAERIGAQKTVSSTLGNIGGIYVTQKIYDLALQYLERGLALNEEMDNKSGIVSSLFNIGTVHLSKENYELATDYFQKAMAVSQEIGYKRGIAHYYSVMGGLYQKQQDFGNALLSYEKALILNQELSDRKSIADTYNSMGFVYLKQGKYKLALEYCQKGLALAQDINALKIQKNGCQCLYDTYKTLGNSEKALAFMEQLRIIDDSLNAQETSKKLEQMEFAKVLLHDSIAKAEEVRMLQEAHLTEVQKKERNKNIFMYSGLALLLLAGGLYSRVVFIRKSRAIIEKERDRSDNLLLNILPAEIAAELKEKGKADARDFDMVSILFTDFKDFTEQSEKMSAANLVDEINHCFQAFDTIMEKYRIEKIKTIGDAYMAAGGLPVPTDDSIKNTVLAALEMQAFIQARKVEKDALGQPAFEMRVGIHTGPVVAGIVGVKKFQYDIWGDTVNTASRMESSGEVGKVNISEATYDLLKNEPNFAFESRGKIEAKGKGEIEMYFVSVNNE
jgi:adenylate cyclase